MRAPGRRRGRIRDELVLGLAAVAVLSAVTTYAVFLLSFRSHFDTLVERNDVEIAAGYASALADHYRGARSWDGIGAVIEGLRVAPPKTAPAKDGPRASSERRHPRGDDIPLVFTDARGVRLYDGLRAAVDERGGRLPERMDTEGGAPVVVDGEPVGYVFFKSMLVRSYNPQEEAFIDSLTSSIGASVAVGLALAILFGAVLAARFARPVVALDRAATAIASGDLGARVPVVRRDEIGSLAENFNLMGERLEATEKERQNLLADIAHELRTPVSVIQANLELMLDGVYAADEARLSSLHEETRILSALIADLRSLSDLEVGSTLLRPEPVRLDALAEETRAKFEPLFRERAVALALSLPAGDAAVRAEGEKLRQVLRNILGNALKYAPGGSRVSLSVERTAGGEGAPALLRVTIADEGPGVPPGSEERIFERFYRVDASRNRESGGRGLGLAICRKIVEASGGRIGAYNRRPAGLAVWFELPEAAVRGAG
jgi:signal transduction histidine kinase